MSFFGNNSKLSKYLEFLWAMIEREFKARYKRALFGFLWVIINPLLQMIIIGTIFSFFIKIPNYFLFLFSGLLPWSFFSLSFSKATSSYISERLLLKKAKFPKEFIPASIILSNFLHLIVSLGLFIIVLLFFGLLNPTNLLLLIPGLIWLVIFTLGISFFTAVLQVRFRDINFITQTLLVLWFYSTPILYSINQIPERLNVIFRLNPLTSVFEIFHCALVNQCEINSQILIINLLMTLLVVIIGFCTFKALNKYLVDWL